VLQNPLRRLFREAAFAGAADNDRNDGHAFTPRGKKTSPRILVSNCDLD
jgi:hypothetical protein